MAEALLFFAKWLLVDCLLIALVTAVRSTFGRPRS